MTAPSSCVSNEIYEPLVTIAIPTFNRAALLQGCVDAALHQSYSNVEVLVSDNASTDETSKMLKGLSDRRLRVMTQERNLGLLPNWNALLREARGEFVIFVPDDDRIGHRMLERSLALVRTVPQVSIVLALFDVNMVAEGRIISPVPHPTLVTGVYDGPQLLRDIFKGRIRYNMCAILLRTEALRARGGFPNNLPFCGDVGGWWPLLLTGKAGFINEPCGTFSVHSTSETSRLELATKIADVERVINLIAAMADDSLKDLRERRALKSEANRFFRRLAVGLLGWHFMNGGKLSDGLPLIWRWRRRLGLYGAARPIAAQVLPTPIVRCVRHVMHALG